MQIDVAVLHGATAELVEPWGKSMKPAVVPVLVKLVPVTAPPNVPVPPALIFPPPIPTLVAEVPRVVATTNPPVIELDADVESTIPSE
jgi:hypothetical protein